MEGGKSMSYVYIVESNGGGVYIGKSNTKITITSTTVATLTDCISDDAYLGTCQIAICAAWIPCEEGITEYENDLVIAATVRPN